MLPTHRQRIIRTTRAHGAPTDRQAVSLLAVFVSLVVVVLVTIAVASTIVAVRATEARQRAAADLEQAVRAIDRATLAAATNEDLQDYKMSSARQALLEPILEYYQSYVDAHKNDPVTTPELAAAHYRIAGLHAKLGSMKSIEAMNAGTVCVLEMLQADVDPETLPSLQHWAMDVAAPNEWLRIKGATFTNLPKHAARLFVSLQSAKNRFIDAHRAAPDAVRPRDELANLRKYTAMFLERQNQRPRALGEWSDAAELLETLVRDQPANTDYQARLAEALVATGKLQAREQDTDAAVKSFQRTVELLEQLLAAAPQDEALAKDLETAQNELAKVLAAAVASEPAADEPDNADKESAPAEEDDKTAEPAEKEAAEGDSDEKEAAPAEEPKEGETPAPAAPDESAPDEAVPEASSDESDSEAPSDDASSDEADVP